MTELTPIQLDDGTVIYLEATAGTVVPLASAEITAGEEEVLVERGLRPVEYQKRVIDGFQAIESTIRSYTRYALNAFKQVEIANVDKVTLRFGVKVSAEAGVACITKGTAESNLDITVECSFPKAPPRAL